MRNLIPGNTIYIVCGRWHVDNVTKTHAFLSNRLETIRVPLHTLRELLGE